MNEFRNSDDGVHGGLLDGWLVGVAGLALGGLRRRHCAGGCVGGCG